MGLKGSCKRGFTRYVKFKHAPALKDYSTEFPSLLGQASFPCSGPRYTHALSWRAQSQGLGFFFSGEGGGS